MKFKSDIYEAIYKDAIEMFKIGAISEARMREYSDMCLVQETESAYTTKQSAENENASPVIAYQ